MKLIFPFGTTAILRLYKPTPPPFGRSSLENHLLHTYVYNMRETFQQDLDTELHKLKRVARRLDALFRIPGTKLTVGVDNLLGFIPVIGDIAAMIPALWLVWRARQLGATPGAQLVMLTNLAIDVAIGSIPLIGDLFDIAYNANIRNMRLLDANLRRRAASARHVVPAEQQA